MWAGFVSLFMMGFGIYLLATGKLQLSGTKVVDGTALRIVGVIFILNFPLQMATYLIWVLVRLFLFRGNSPETLGWIVVLLGFGVTIACFLLGLAIALANAHRPPRKVDNDYDADDFREFMEKPKTDE